MTVTEDIFNSGLSFSGTNVNGEAGNVNLNVKGLIDNKCSNADRHERRETD